MFVVLIRTVVLYLFIIAGIRLLGKHQIGELEPSELVLTLIIADLASVPMQDNGIPLLSGLIPIVVLLALSSIISVLCTRSIKFRTLLCGKPSIIVENGQIIEAEIRKNRLTIDELMEELRIQGYPDFKSIKFALLTTNAHFHDISQNKNFLILLVDAVEAETFEAVLESNEEYREVFRDFTYYSNTASVYPYTRDSMPLLLTGAVNRNEQEFGAFASEAYNSSPLFERLDAENYDIGIYMDEPVWYGERRFRITSDIKNNMASPYENMDFNMYFRQEMKYILFKYLPYAYKQYAQIEGFDFGMALEMYNYRYNSVYNMLLENPELVKTDRNVFQFVHVEGAHLPFDYDKDMNLIEKGTYSQKVEATIKVIDTWLSRLKNSGAYDNSVILIMADHGYYDVDHDSYGEEVLERFHPVLLVKGMQENHELAESDVPVSHIDLMDAYMELLDGKKSGEIFRDTDPDRKRQVIWYEYRSEEHMVEYQLEGNRFERQDFRPTGRVFDR